MTSAIVHIRQDTPGALDQLTAAISRGRLDHAVAQIRQQAAEDAVIDAAREALAAGLTKPPDYPAPTTTATRPAPWPTYA